MLTYVQAAQYTYTLFRNRIGTMQAFQGVTDAYWVAGNTFNTLLDYWSNLGQKPDMTAVSMFMDYFHQTVPSTADQTFLNKLAQKGLDGGPWLDDHGWWGNAILTALENAIQFGFSSELISTLTQDAKNCWYLMQYGWDAQANPLPGGVYNCKKQDWAMTGRNSVTNLVFWLMSIRLAAYTKDDTYLTTADSLNWFEQGFAQGDLFDQGVNLVRERMKGMWHTDESDGFYWAGDQGLFIACLMNEPRQMSKAFGAKMSDVANGVTKLMIDKTNILHDHVLNNPDFDNDYAVGKGVFMRHAMRLAQTLPQNSDLAKTIFASAQSAYKTAYVDPGFNRFINFNWNPTAQLPKSTSEWDTTNRATLSAFRTIILLAAGLNAFIAAAVLDPNGIISVDETENKPEPALT